MPGARSAIAASAAASRSSASTRKPQAASSRECRPRRPDFPLLEGHQRQSIPHHIQKFAGAQQKFRIGRLAEALVADHEGFIDQHPVVLQRVEQHRQERAKQVIGDDNPVELASAIRPRTAFEVGEPRHDVGRSGRNPDQNSCIPVNRFDLVTEFGQQEGMPAVTAGQIEYRAAHLDQRQEALHPM